MAQCDFDSTGWFRRTFHVRTVPPGRLPYGSKACASGLSNYSRRKGGGDRRPSADVANSRILASYPRCVGAYQRRGIARMRASCVSSPNRGSAPTAPRPLWSLEEELPPPIESCIYINRLRLSIDITAHYAAPPLEMIQSELSTLSAGRSLRSYISRGLAT
jgi:hypothetical protein